VFLVLGTFSGRFKRSALSHQIRLVKVNARFQSLWDVWNEYGIVFWKCGSSSNVVGVRKLVGNSFDNFLEHLVCGEIVVLFASY